MSFYVTLRLRETGAVVPTLEGADGVFFVNPGTFGEPMDLYAKAASKSHEDVPFDYEVGERIVFINSEAMLSAEIVEHEND